jgi:hypothetical protein
MKWGNSTLASARQLRGILIVTCFHTFFKGETMSSMTDKMRKAGTGTGAAHEAGTGIPKKGDHFRCEQCGMAIQVTADCKCQEPDHVYFQCCGEEMQRA